MSRARSDDRILPSLLDRLIDDDPTNSREASKARSQVNREMKSSIRRDLENLLNTRSRCTPLPPELKELERSLVEYGLPDFTGTNLSGSDNRDRLRSAIEQTLRRFETRFKKVEVLAIESSSPTDRTLTFRINALLDIEPAPEMIAFDSALEPLSGNFVLTATRHV